MTPAAPSAPPVQIDLRTGAGIEHGEVTVRGVRVHYRHAPGPGPVLLLLPGGMLDSSALAWKKTLEALPAAYRVLVPDLPGYGRSDTPLDAAYTTDYYVRFVADFLDAVGVERAGVFGSSMAGAVALGFALARPERVRVLVLMGAYGLQPRVRLHGVARRLAAMPGVDAAVRALLQSGPAVVRAALPVAVHDPAAIDDELVADTRAGLDGSHALTAFVRWLRSELRPGCVRTDFTPRLAELDLPVLVLHGTHDLMIPVDAARRAAARLPCATLHTFDAGHLVARERPEAVNAVLLAWLNLHLPLAG